MSTTSVIISGGLGFLGRRLAQRVLQRGSLCGPCGTQMAVERVILFDTPKASTTSEDTFDPSFQVLDDPKVRVVKGDIGCAETCSSLIDSDNLSVFHLASIMSGQGEEDFELCHRVNLQGTLNLLEACRLRCNTRPRFIFSSSVAVFGPQATVTDDTKHIPETTYGCTKAISELLVNDYTRRGFVNGRSARLPTVVVRPGKPNAATTSCFSGVIREPLLGKSCEMPVDMSLPHPVTGERALVDGMIALHEASDELVERICPGTDRAVQMPSFSTTLQELSDAATAVGVKFGIDLGDTTSNPDERLNKIVSSFASSTDSERAVTLGCPMVVNAVELAEDFVADFIPQERMHSAQAK
eukprot:g5452.t1